MFKEGELVILDDKVYTVSRLAGSHYQVQPVGSHYLEHYRTGRTATEAKLHRPTAWKDAQAYIGYVMPNQPMRLVLARNDGPNTSFSEIQGRFTAAGWVGENGADLERTGVLKVAYVHLSQFAS